MIVVFKRPMDQMTMRTKGQSERLTATCILSEPI